MTDFKSLGVSNWILAQLKEVGILKPTPVQVSCIPPILDGRDCVGVAKTGSGKTLAFAIPILQTLSEDPYGIYALILTPTRELAFQISDQFNVIGTGMGLRTCVVVGGRDTIMQSKDLDKRPHVVIATPGRLADHIENNSTFSLSKIKYLVMDEADRLLEGGFDGQLSEIISALPKNRQTLLFTATNSPIIGETVSACPNNPHVWECETVGETATVSTLEQRFILTPFEAKNAYLVQLVLETREKKPKDSIMIFTRTCKTAELLERTFIKIGVSCSSLHSMKPQKERMSSLSQFKSNHTKVLIATDVASRGLDIPEVQLVVNHNVPSAARDYVHRVGRTARAGRVGRAVTLVTPTQVGLLQDIEKETKVRMEELSIDDTRVGEIILQVNTTLREVDIELGEQDWDEKKNINKRKKIILEGKNPDQVQMEKEKRIKKRKQASKEKRKKMKKTDGP
ncbi:probable ATP-dependent RNA helicase DDX49 [Eurytemora carolleeae]|uniref:probable ATP-dependent RNA helicase DDX49 n=1 Tax=Eurytemora carolleeae TaxID=1294199 RepID=UPI000C7822FD|nr:probable ATP-dependent RNA helicase DDX49 [Eurytemora carolleeae]XP_023348724.1 probable ATP-dependent RNA helicase DDX49 [Eurytemora carolleeae]|eukprot:XP_023333384.1 probable ATP-dependent RNA helicase DDX49 [Eurytemora affinis]